MKGDFGPGAKMEKVLKEGDLLNIPDTDRQVEVYKYIPNFDPKNPMNTRTLKPDNPRIIVGVYENKTYLGLGAAMLDATT